MRSYNLEAHKRLFTSFSETTIKHRFFNLASKSFINENLIRNLVDIDPDNELIISAWRGELELGMAQLFRDDQGTAELAIVVADSYQGKGLGRYLTESIIECADQAKISRVYGYILADNRKMLSLCQKLNFRIELIPEDGTYLVRGCLKSF